MGISDKQTPINELLSELSDKINLHLGENYVRNLTKAAGISNPVISALRSKQTENISLKTFVQIANAIGYKVVKIQLEKIEE